METDQLYFFIATCVASVFGFVLAFILNRFVNKLDSRMDQYDKLFAGMQEEISDIKTLVKVQDNRIEHLEDKVYPVRYDKKK